MGLSVDDGRQRRVNMDLVLEYCRSEPDNARINASFELFPTEEVVR